MRTYMKFLAGLLTTALLVLGLATPAQAALTEKRSCQWTGEGFGICFAIFKRSQNDGSGIVVERLQVWSIGDESELEGCPSISWQFTAVAGGGDLKMFKDGSLCRFDYHDVIDTEAHMPANTQLHSWAKFYDNFGRDNIEDWYWDSTGCNPCPV